MKSVTGEREHDPQVNGIASTASPEEAAAIVAALERFMRDTAPPAPAPAPARMDGWHVAAIREGVSRDPWAALTDPALASPWINT